MVTWVVLGALLTVTAAQEEPATLQLGNYLKATNGSLYPLTTSAGSPVSYKDANDILKTNLIRSTFFMETITHIVAENIPERIVHAKGAGALGYFEVTKDFTKYSKAKLFEKVGKRTPVASRIGPLTGPKGGADLARTLRGLALKFYTEEGNWDMPAMNTPMFPIKEPLLFSNEVHMLRPNPVTNLHDDTAIWDVLALRPEGLFTFMYLNSDKGIGDGFRNFDAYSIHTLQLENADGELHFARFSFIPENGTKYIINSTEAAAREADWGIRDLYNNIAEGNYPVWIMYAQLLTHEQVKNDSAKIFDTTRILSEDEYPLTEIGRVVLNRNPTNYFADVEQIAFCPSNLVPGISGAPDTLYESRMLAYRLARNQRLGINSNNVPVNQPLTPSVNYLRDGTAPVNPTNYAGPNYYPNSFNGPVPLGTQSKNLIEIEEDPSANNFDQAKVFYLAMSVDEKTRLVENLASTISKAEKPTQERVVVAFSQIDCTLADSIDTALANIAASS